MDDEPTRTERLLLWLLWHRDRLSASWSYQITVTTVLTLDSSASLITTTEMKAQIAALFVILLFVVLGRLAIVFLVIGYIAFMAIIW